MRLYEIIGSVAILATLFASVGFSEWSYGSNIIHNGNFAGTSNYSQYWFNGGTEMSAKVNYSDSRFYLMPRWEESAYQTQSMPDGNYTLTLEYYPVNMDYGMVVNWSQTSIANSGLMATSCAEKSKVFNSTHVRNYWSATMLNESENALVSDMGGGWKRLVYNFTATSCSINSNNFFIKKNRPNTNFNEDFYYFVRNYSIFNKDTSTELMDDSGISGTPFVDATGWDMYVDSGYSHLADGAFKLNWSDYWGDFGYLANYPTWTEDVGYYMTWKFMPVDERSGEVVISNTVLTFNQTDAVESGTSYFSDLGITSLGDGWYQFWGYAGNASEFQQSDFSFYSEDPNLDETYYYLIDDVFVGEATWTPEPFVCQGWQCSTTARAVVGMSPLVVGLGLLAGMVSMFLMRSEDESMIALVVKGGVIALVSVVMLTIMMGVIG